MQCGERTRCPSCGNILVEEEKIRYGGKNDCRSEPFLICPACGWKKRCRQGEDLLFNYRL